MSTTTLVSILAALGLGTPIGIILTGIFNRKRGKVDAAAVVQGMAIGVAEEIRQQLKDVRDELNTSKQTIAQMEARIDALEETVDKQDKKIMIYEGTLNQHNIPLPVV